MKPSPQKVPNEVSVDRADENQTVSLNTPFFDERTPIQPHGPPTGERAEPLRWLTVEQIRKMQRMRRTTVVAAMLSGELPFEQRGRIRYARLTDVLIWEERRIAKNIPKPSTPTSLIHDDFKDLA